MATNFYRLRMGLAMRDGMLLAGKRNSDIVRGGGPQASKTHSWSALAWELLSMVRTRWSRTPPPVLSTTVGQLSTAMSSPTEWCVVGAWSVQQ